MAVGEARPIEKEAEVAPPSWESITLGDIVYYRLHAGRSIGECRPAIVVMHWGHGTVNLQVFVDNTNDGYGVNQGCIWVTSAVFKEKPEPRTWYWSPD